MAVVVKTVLDPISGLSVNSPPIFPSIVGIESDVFRGGYDLAFGLLTHGHMDMSRNQNPGR